MRRCVAAVILFTCFAGFCIGTAAAQGTGRTTGTARQQCVALNGLKIPAR